MIPEPLRYDQSSNYATCQTVIIRYSEPRLANPADCSLERAEDEQQRTLNAQARAPHLPQNAALTAAPQEVQKRAEDALLGGEAAAGGGIPALASRSAKHSA